MNKLFIGPYSQSSYTGILSKLYLQHILSFDNNVNNIVSREYGYGKRQLEPSEIPPSEHKTLSGHDVIIQNLSPENLVAKTKFKRNILIPNLIANQSLNFEQYSEKFKLADLILVNNTLDYQKIISTNVDPNKLKQFSLPLSISPATTNKKIQLGLFDDWFKFYFIGDYTSNLEIIRSLIVSFCDTFRNKECYLILWLTCTAQQRSELLDFYQNIKQSFGIVNSLDNILFICRPIDYNEIPAIHNTGDVYLAINDDYYPFIDEQMALLFESYVLSREQLVVSYAPSLSQSRSQSVGSIAIDSLGSKMLDRFNNRSNIPKKNKTKPTLHSLI